MFNYHVIKESTFGSLLLLLSVSVIFGTSEVIKLFTNNGEEIFKTSTYNWVIRLCLIALYINMYDIQSTYREAVSINNLERFNIISYDIYCGN